MELKWDNNSLIFSIILQDSNSPTIFYQFVFSTTAYYWKIQVTVNTHFLSTYLTSGSMDSRLTKIWIRVHQVNSCWQKFLNAVSRISSKMCPVVRYTCALAVHRNVFWWDLVLWPFLFVYLTWGDSRALRAGHHAHPKESFHRGPRKVSI